VIKRETTKGRYKRGRLGDGFDHEFEVYGDKISLLQGCLQYKYLLF
jgi:hypothetical protein